MNRTLFGRSYKNTLYMSNLATVPVCGIDNIGEKDFDDLLYTVASLMCMTGADRFAVFSVIDLERYDLVMFSSDGNGKYYYITIEDVLRLVDKDVAIAIIKYKEDKLTKLKNTVYINTKSARNV